MGLSTRKGPLYVLNQQILEMIDYNYSMQKYKGFIYIYRDHKVLLTSLVEVVNGDSHFRAIEVNITAQLCICLSEDLYCHGVLHLLRCGLHTYLVDKDNRVPSSFYY